MGWNTDDVLAETWELVDHDPDSMARLIDLAKDVLSGPPAQSSHRAS